jgi:hypothetical protein
MSPTHSPTRTFPLTAGVLLVDGEMHRHSAVRGDVAPRLHPLVRRILDELPPAHRERYAGWCAETVLVSDRLFAAELDSAGPLTPAAARAALWGGVVRVVRVREEGDPAHGEDCPPCRSCAVLLDWFGVEASGVEASGVERSGVGTSGPRDTSADVAARSPQRAQALARQWSLRLAGYAAPDGRHHDVVPAAVAAYAEFGGRRVRPDGGGDRVAASGFLIDPVRAIHSVRTLADLAAALGARLTPLGVEEPGTGLLAVDEYGRLFVLDHTAEWWLGDSVEEGLDTLSRGRAPLRLRADGTWT